QPLGTVTPIVDCFPDPAFVSDRGTVMCLRIDNGYDIAELISAMKRLDPRILLFLRKLRIVELSVTEPSGDRWSAQLRRGELVPASDGLGCPALDLFKDGTRQRYALTSHLVRNLKPSSRRQNRTESELRLGFAVSDNGALLL